LTRSTQPVRRKRRERKGRMGILEIAGLGLGNKNQEGTTAVRPKKGSS